MDRARGTAPTRRAVLRGMAALGAVPFARLGLSAETAPSVTQLTRELHVVSGAGGNVVVLTTDAGQVLVDSGAAAGRDGLVRALAELPGGGTVTAVLNTHWHADQVGGNETFGGNGATIIAHEKTRQRLSAGWYVPSEDRYEQPLRPPGRPTKTFYTSDSTTIGGRRIDYGYLIEAHTDGDIFVSFPEANVIAVGGVVSPAADPVLDWFGGGWLGGRVDALARLLEMSGRDTRFVPSDGPVVGRAAVQAEHDLMLELFERFVTHVRRGESAADMLAAGVMEGLDRTFADPGKFLYDAHKGIWAHHNKLMPDIV